MADSSALYNSYIGEHAAHLQAVCRGEFCACCDTLLPSPPWERAMRLCRTCWPQTGVRWHRLLLSLMWSSGDWSLCFGWPTPVQTGPNVGYWLLLHDRAECTSILDRYLCSQTDRAAFDAQDDRAGHQTIAIFVNDRRLHALAEATRRDPRTGYDKRKRR